MMPGIDATQIIVTSKQSDHVIRYHELEQLHPHAQFIYAERNNSLHQLTCTCISTAKSPYIVLTHDYCHLEQPIDLQSCINNLVKTGAYGFYFTLGKSSTFVPGLRRKQKTPPLINVWDTIYAWRFSEGEYSWRSQYTASMALYRTEDIKKKLLQDNNDTWLAYPWGTLDDEHCVGLCFEEAPASILPLDKETK